jgi:hypothetical protein
MATSTPDRQPLVESIPDPDTIRKRIYEIRAEGRILRDLLPIAEKRQRLSLQGQSGRKDGGQRQ